MKEYIDKASVDIVIVFLICFSIKIIPLFLMSALFFLFYENSTFTTLLQYLKPKSITSDFTIVYGILFAPIIETIIISFFAIFQNKFNPLLYYCFIFIFNLIAHGAKPINIIQGLVFVVMAFYYNKFKLQEGSFSAYSKIAIAHSLFNVFTYFLTYYLFNLV